MFKQNEEMSATNGDTVQSLDPTMLVRAAQADIGAAVADAFGHAMKSLFKQQTKLRPADGRDAVAAAA